MSASRGPAGRSATSWWRRGVSRWGGVLHRRFAFASRGNVVAACLLACLVAGLWSLARGQDANWDLRNYHLYNGYAALGGRWLIDLAPAQMQSYFHPLLDVVQYLAMANLPAPWVGFLLGCLHGLVFALVAAIAWRVLADDPRRAVRVPLLAMAALASGAFVSELGNTMADNTTALFVLGAVACVLRAQAQQRAGRLGTLAWTGAGLLLGIAVALKLTNALYAVALGLAALCDGGRWHRRIGGTTLMTLAALAVFALVGGAWFRQVWLAFGNPLFPQFNVWFDAPLAQPVAVSDTRFLPKRLGERLAWPLLFTARPWRVSEIALTQIVWALLYLVLVAGLLRGAWARVRGRPRATGAAPETPSPAAPAARVLCVYVAAAYLLWQWMFSIHRYLVAVEVLLPLLIWWLWPRLLPTAWTRWRVPALAACVLVALLGGRDWGHEPWARQAVTVPAPPMATPGDSAIVLVGGQPQAWRVPALPPEAVYLGVGTNFPASAEYDRRVIALLQGRPHRYAMLEAVVDRRAERLGRLNDWARRLGWDAQPGCRMLRRAVKWGVRAVLDESAGRCVLRQRPDKAIDVAAADAQLRAEANARLAPLGWQLDLAGCRRQPAWIGATLYPYQWCRLVPAP